MSLKPPKFQREQIQQKNLLKEVRNIWDDHYKTFGFFKVVTQNLSLTMWVILAYSVFATIGSLIGGYGSVWITLVPFILLVFAIGFAIYDRFVTMKSLLTVTKEVQKKHPNLSQHDIVMICNQSI